MMAKGISLGVLQGVIAGKELLHGHDHGRVLLLQIVIAIDLWNHVAQDVDGTQVTVPDGNLGQKMHGKKQDGYQSNEYKRLRRPVTHF